MVCSSIKGDLKKIFLESSCCSPDEIEQLQDELIQNGKLKYDITFSEIKSVPLEVIESLVKIKDKATIHTTQRMLWLYLSNLNIKSHYLKSVKFSNFINKDIKALAIGGSAGSIEKIMQIIKNLPYVDITVFITVHLLPDAKSYLCEILQNETQYIVKQAKHKEKIKKNHIYVATPSSHMLVKDGHIELSDTKSMNFAKPSIDMMFKSVSDYYKHHAIAIITCGYGKDGSVYLPNLQENKTEVIIEDPSSCEAQDMLLNAINTNNYNRILTIDQIEQYLDLQLYTNLFLEDEIDSFLEDIYSFYGFDFRNYEKKSITRRVQKTQTILGVNDFNEFKSLVFNNSEALDALVRNFSINVTTFFRNPEVFGDIRKLFTKKFQNLKNIRVWCAGCSSGQEPYSVAILLHSMGLLERTQIYATDFDGSILIEATNGIYPLSALEQYRENFEKSEIGNDIEEYFEINENYVKVKDFIKEKILFFEHNLATDGSINEFHLILCRNVIIYFDRLLKQRVFSLIDESLDKDGILVLGESELPLGLTNYKNVGTNIKYKIYQKMI
jgi:chemotaxis protein methyltransferase CheR